MREVFDGFRQFDYPSVLLRLDKKISRKDLPGHLNDLEGVASVEVLSC